MPLFFGTPGGQPLRQQLTVGQATEQFQPFSNLYRGFWDAVLAGAVPGFSPNQISTWRAAFREGIVNVGGKPSKINFFREAFGGTPKEIEATDYYIKYNSRLDFNIYSQNGGTNTVYTSGSPLAGCNYGQYVDANFPLSGSALVCQFQIAAGTYSPDGMESNIAVGQTIHVPTDGHDLLVIKVDKSVPYAHQVYAVPSQPGYTPDVLPLQAMSVNRMITTSGYSDTNTSPVTSQFQSNGYIKLVQPYQLRTDSETPKDLDAAYQDVLQFAILFDPVTGAKIDTFDFLAMQSLRENALMSENQYYWMGEPKTNPAIFGTGITYTNKYGGFYGLVPSIFYGGGYIDQYDPGVGWDLDSNWLRWIYQIDAQKKSTEYVMIGAKKLLDGINRKANQMYQNNSGSCTFETFKWWYSPDGSAPDQEGVIKRLDIRSFYAWGNTLHMKWETALSDQNFIGIGYMPNFGIMLPGEGNVDSNGMQTPPVEFLIPKGRMENYDYREWFQDMEQTGDLHATKWHFEIRKTIQMAVHGVENDLAIVPTVIQ
jgi:hypothetical protein